MWKRNGLSLVLLVLTFVFFCWEAVAGHHVKKGETGRPRARADRSLALPRDGALRQRHVRKTGRASSCRWGSLRCFQGEGRAEEAEQQLKGLPPPGFVEHLASSTFWFESMQNWQKKFFRGRAVPGGADVFPAPERLAAIQAGWGPTRADG
ncbi:hypothetical protein DdX_22362 [Ditylenchus destructor]|uniref:Uncharacterized protein n=1 Tax=Ditylenchus destructor TaxID=166010 RepID=A0AAD4QUS0_9BILA|nr:hypothetical protein DdX_22362 [Ditylenchus destructor]